MPKRKRRDKRAAQAPQGPPVDPSVAMFARRHRESIDEQKAQQRARNEERRRADEHSRLQAAKADAVTTLKRLKAAGHATAEQRDAAELAYRAATADLIAFETGERPAWAPVDEPEGADAAAAEPGAPAASEVDDVDEEVPAEGRPAVE